MSESNAQLIHSLCTEQADAFAHAADLLPEAYQNDPARILAACLVAHALDLNPATVMFGRHLEMPPAAPQKAAAPKKAEKPAEKTTNVTTWPQMVDGIWVDSAGTHYEPGRDGWNKTDKMPSVKADGTFRAARQGKKDKPATVNPADLEGEAQSGDSEQAMIEANQVLASFKNHINNASASDRLEQLGAQIELMGFTPSELTVARRWIAERAEALATA